MKFKILLSSTFIFFAVIATAQKNNIAYAITGDGVNNFNWMNIREINLATGQVGATVFQHNKTNFTITDVDSKKVSDQTATASLSAVDYPTGTFVAAAAYDVRSNRLYFAPMMGNQLRWLDLDTKNKTPKFYNLTSSVLKTGDMNDEANHITRMVIGADGNGYAVTNDGNHFIRFTTGKKPVLTDLGNLVDADESNGISIHNKCSSWGGDMLADAFGKLYIISANRNVFVIDPSTRVTSFKGTITGLPATYSTNGAAVDDDGNIIVSSANVFEGYYKLKLADLKASKIEGSDQTYSASDLANSNLLLQKEADANNKFDFLPPTYTAELNNKIFPNPVTGNSFKVLLDGHKEGGYTILLTDIAGRALQTTKLNMAKGQQYQTVVLATRPTPGTYLVKVLDAQQQIILTEKLIIQ